MAHTVTIDGRTVTLTNLDKVMYPETGFTKGQVVEYYTRVGPTILPHLRDRPITLKRYPDGVGSEHFYEKNAPSFTPEWIETFSIPSSGARSKIRYILINDLATLVWSANLANLEIHPFLSRAPRIDVPTMVVFDLDPGDGADILGACEAALLVKDLLDRLGLSCLVKVSGSKGIHLHVPLNSDATYGMTRPFAHSIAQFLEQAHPRFIVSEMARSKRKGRVFIDWSQNSEHKSTVAVYSLRAGNGRPFVAMPVTWSELERALKKKDPSALFFEPGEALERIENTGDLFAPMLTLRQVLPEPFRKIEASGRQEQESAGSLDTYRRKRNFAKTPEPPPSVPVRGEEGGRLFVVQKHAARRLHYDFRLEMGGALKSWAVPKGPPYEQNERRLAMATEDHPLEYARFEGTIPKGEYGGGTVMVWDIGTYELIDGNYGSGKLHLRLAGKKLRGEWVLVKDRGRSKEPNTWYLIKAGDTMDRLDPAEDDSSALTGRSLEEIAAAEDAVWHSNPNGRSDTRPPIIPDFEELPAGRNTFVEPMLAAEVAELPDRDGDWIYEVKLDGYRCLASREARDVKLYSRRGNLLNDRFPNLARALLAAPPGTLIDGEIVALDESGRPSFNLLQNLRTAGQKVYFYAFDLLLYRGKNLMRLPLEQRRAQLVEVIEAMPPIVRMSEGFAGTPQQIVAAARDLGLEGVIAKRKDSRYEPGKRSGAWLKYKIHKSDEFVIGGYTPGHPFDAIVVGQYDREKLMFVAKVRNGFVPRSRSELARRFKGLEVEKCPFANLPEPRRTAWALTRAEMSRCVWLEPKLVAQIEFTEWTPDRHLRHPRFVRLREDKTAAEVKLSQ